MDNTSRPDLPAPVHRAGNRLAQECRFHAGWSLPG